MFGQSYMRYEIFPKLNGPVIEKIIDQYSIIKPIKNHNENYHLIEYNMLQTVNLDYLMQCIPFIKITFGQFLIIIRDIFLTIQKYIHIGLVPQYLQAKNIYLILTGKNCQFTHYYSKLTYNLDLIGVNWIQAKNKDQYLIESFNQKMKTLTLELFNLFIEKYERYSDTQMKTIFHQFQYEFFQHNEENVLAYIEWFLDNYKCDMELQYFKCEFKQLRENNVKFSLFIKKGQDLIEEEVSKLQTKKFNKQLENNIKQTILSSLKSYLFSVLYSELEVEIKALIIILDRIPEFTLKLQQKLLNFNELIDFDNKQLSFIFQYQFDQSRRLKEYYSNYCNIETNWISQIETDFINKYFIIAGQCGKLNNYIGSIQVLNYIKALNSKIEITKEVFKTPFQIQDFEEELIKLLEQYLKEKLDKLF